MSPPLILHPGAAQGLWRGLRRGRVATVATPLHFWWFGVYFLMGFLAEAWEHKGYVGAAMPGGGLRGRFGGLCIAKPPQCLWVSQAPARRGRGNRAEPRGMPINSLRISPPRLSVTLLQQRRGWQNASVCPAVLAGLVSALQHRGRSRAEGARACGAGIGSRIAQGAVVAVSLCASIPEPWVGGKGDPVVG